jgi:uncharacterized membrane protein YtjA (UPF0391 family)
MAMLRWASGLLVIGLIAGILGFGGIASGGSSIARICFFVFLGGFAFAVIGGLMRRRRIPRRP